MAFNLRKLVLSVSNTTAEEVLANLSLFDVINLPLSKWEHKNYIVVFPFTVIEVYTTMKTSENPRNVKRVHSWPWKVDTRILFRILE